MTYHEFLSDVLKAYDKQKKGGGDLRLGQMYFNALVQVRPDIAEVLRGSMLDPFFKDRVAAVVSDFVLERW